MKILIPAIAVFSITTAALTVRPARQDFGEAAIAAVVTRTFQVALPPAADTTVTFSVSITGPDAIDFNAADVGGNSKCEESAFLPGWRAGSCVQGVDFRPTSIGIKTATLVVSDSRGNRGTAALTGKGVLPICEFKVVSCNYSHLYTGVVRWSNVIRGPYGSTTTNVQVDVVLGVASCNGSQANFDAPSGRTRRGDVTGTGLIGVEFEKDEEGRLVYNVTVACPSPAFGATEDAAAIPSQPAEIGHFYEQSYKQPAESVGMDLVGSTSYQDGAADPVNGVDGTVTMSWSLKRS